MGIGTNDNPRAYYVALRLALRIASLQYPDMISHDDRIAFARGLIVQFEREWQEWEQERNERTLAN